MNTCVSRFLVNAAATAQIKSTRCSTHFQICQASKGISKTDQIKLHIIKERISLACKSELTRSRELLSSVKFNKAILITYKTIFIPTLFANAHTHRYTYVKGVLMSAQLKEAASQVEHKPCCNRRTWFQREKRLSLKLSKRLWVSRWPTPAPAPQLSPTGLGIPS